MVPGWAIRRGGGEDVAIGEEDTGEHRGPPRPSVDLTRVLLGR